MGRFGLPAPRVSFSIGGNLKDWSATNRMGNYDRKAQETFRSDAGFHTGATREMPARLA